MTVLTKIVFSVALLAAGFWLASLLGPPELADGFANALRPGAPPPSWGALQPLDESSLNDPAWGGYEAAAFRPAAPINGAQPSPGRTLAASQQRATPGVGPAPLWPSEDGAPIASWEPVPEKALANTPAPRRDFGVAAAAWREPTAAVGWPKHYGEVAADTGRPVQQPTTAPQAAWPRTSAPPTAEPTTASEPTPGSSVGPRYSNQPQLPPIPPVSSQQTIAPQPSADTGWGSWGAAAAPAAAAPSDRFRASDTFPRVSAAPVAAASPLPAFPSAGREQALTPVTPVAETQPAGPGFGAATDQPIRHVVIDGDTLARLAKRYLDNPQRAGEIFLANQPRLANPDLLPIGAELVIPAKQGTATAGPANPVAPRARLLGPQAAPAAGLAQW